MDTRTANDSQAHTRKLRLAALRSRRSRFRRTGREFTPDSLLWRLLDKKRMHGHKFERQYRFPNLVVDCYCPSARLAVEIERSSHQSRRMEEVLRDRLLRAHGLRVLRFSEEMIRERPHVVKNAILEELGATVA